MKLHTLLSRLYTPLLWVSTIWGLLLLINTLELAAHMILAAVLFAVVMLSSVRKKTAARVTARVLCLLLPIAFAILLGVYTYFYLLVVQSGGTVALSDQPQTILAVIGTPLLGWQVMAAAFYGKKGSGYDRFVTQILYTLLAILTCYCALGEPQEYLLWIWNAAWLRYPWLVLTVGGCLLGWVQLYSAHRKKKTGEA